MHGAPSKVHARLHAAWCGVRAGPAQPSVLAVLPDEAMGVQYMYLNLTAAWEDGEAACRAVGGHLPSLHSAAQHARLAAWAMEVQAAARWVAARVHAVTVHMALSLPCCHCTAHTCAPAKCALQVLASPGCWPACMIV